MTNLTTYPLIDGFETTLAQSWNGATGTVYLNTAPSFTFPSGVKTYIVVNPGKTTMQVGRIDSMNTGNKTVNVDSITIEKGASVNYSAQTHAVGSKVIISDNYQFWKDLATAINSKLDNDGGNTTTTFSLSATGSNFRIRKDGNDMKFRDDSNPEVSLSTLAAAAGVDTKVSVTVNDTTPAVLNSKLTAGDGLSKTVGTPGGNETLDLDIDTTDTTVFVKTSSGAGDENKVPVLNASGKLANGFINTDSISKFGGDSSDGAVDGTADVTITGSNDTYIVKNYSSWVAGTAPRVLTITPTNCLLHIKVKGDCDLTNWTFDFQGKGGQGGASATMPGIGNAGNNGADLIVGIINTAGAGGNPNTSSVGTGGGGGAGSAANGTVGVTLSGQPGGNGGIKAAFGSLTTVLAARRYVMYIGAGGGSGGVGTGAGSNGVSGAGGNGGGAVILEVFGNLTLDNSTTVIDMDATAGGNGVAGTNQGAGGGGGGGGGTFLAIYNGTLTGTVTPTVAGGAAGTGQNGGSTGGSNGGAGSAGEFDIIKNTVFS